MKPQSPRVKPDWKGLQAQAGDVLGADFWQDIAAVIPVTGPRIDMFTNACELVIVIELPGLTSPELIKLVHQERELIVRGSIVRPYGVTDEQMLLSERFFGTFERHIQLPRSAVPQDMRAHYNNGLLIIRMPVAEEAAETPVPIHFR